jgi:hypothetical protein
MIKFPFEKKINSQLISSFYLCTNSIKSNLTIGSLNEKVEIEFDLSRENILIPDSTFKEINYNENKSSSFNFSSDKKYSCSIDYINYFCYKSVENCSLLNLKNKKEKINGLPFLLLQKDKNEIANGKIGLKAKSNIIETSLIYNLKKNNLIEKHIFTISYENDTKGNIIFGNYPHEFNKKKYKENFFFSLPIESPKVNFNWIILFDYISYDLNIKDNYNKVIFDFNFGGILASLLYQKFLNQSFFKNYYLNKLCTLNFFIYQDDYDFKKKFSQIICDKNINITNFPPLNFTKKEYNITFTFTYKDLFRIYNDKYYLMVFFPDDVIFEWILGEPFFWKFETVFDIENAIIGFYEKINQEKSYKYFYLIIIILLSFLVFLLSFLLFFNIKNKPRKKRANELEDDLYEYISDNSNIKNQII